MMNSKYKIFLNIKSLFKKHKPLLEDNGILTKSPDLTKLNKQNLFPLTSLHRYRKESLLNKTSTAYLNSVHPTKLRVNLNEAPSKTKTKKLKYLNVAPEKQMSKSSDVIYEYLKSFSKYSNRKKGLLIKNNQHIAYNFNSKTILKRGDEALLKKIFKKSLKRLNKLKANIIQNKFTILHYIAKAKEFLKKTNKNKKFLLHIKKPSLLDLYPESNKNTSRATFAKKPRTVKNAHMDVHTEIPIDQDQDLILRLKELNSLSAKIKPNRRGNNGLIKYSYKLLFYFFKSMYCLISKPVFLFTPEKVVIQLKYFLIIPKYKVFKWYSILKFKPFRLKREALIRKKLNKNKNKKKKKFFKQEKDKFKFKFKPKIKWKVKRTLIRLINKGSLVQKTLFDLNKLNLFKVFSTKFKLICDILNKKFKKPVEFQLIRIHKPFNDSNILGNLLSLNIRNKKFKTKVRIKKLFKKRVVKNVSDYQNKSVNCIPTYLSGINIRIGGRLMREAFIPRISQKRFERGARSVGKVNYLDTASITNKNRKGSYTLKISSGQNFF